MMDFVELSIESLREESRRLAALIAKDWQPDTVAYLAKGGYLIGLEIAEYFDADLLEISAHRSGDSTKEKTSNLLSKLPKKIRYLLRLIEIKTRLNNDSDKSQQNTMCLTDKFKLHKRPDRLLMVDDSADTGTSIKLAYDLLVSLYPDCTIKVAVLNSFQKANESNLISWRLYTNTLLSTPSSKDNRNYSAFLELYK